MFGGGHTAAHLLIAANITIALAYLVISAIIVRGLVRTGQFGRANVLGTATAAIFFSCAGGHALHVVNAITFEHTAGSHVATWDLAIWDLITAAVAITYLSLRRSYGQLLTKPEMFTDLERERMQRAVSLAEERFRTAFESAPVGVALVGLQDAHLGRILHATKALLEMLARSTHDMEGVLLTALSHGDDREGMISAIDRLRLGSVRVQHEQRLMHADGNAVWTLVSGAAVLDEASEPEHAVVQVLDISERKRFEGQLRHMAEHDPLTGLFNRRRFELELTRCIAHARRYDRCGAVLLLDLDGFKYVNDSLGHSAGDELIVRVGSILRGSLRETDLLARLGGDEFAALLPEATAAEAAEVAGKVLQAIRRQAVLQSPGRYARITGSVGIATFGAEDELTSDDVIAEADIAMYDAKGEGRDRFAIFDADEMRRERLTERSVWLTKLREALELDRLCLFAQPIVGINSNGVERIELLLRYRETDGTLVAPGTFLYLAERFDLVREIDLWVLRQAVRLLHDAHLSGRELAVAVNVSAKTLADDQLPDALAELLAERQIPPGRLVIEITETAAISNIDRAKAFADRLHRLGCRLALDDFGAGFASFYYLKHLDFDYVKIDGEFVRHLPDNATDRLVVQAIVAIARGLGTHTVAEHVADAETVRLLEQLGVDYGQGFHLGMPVPVEELVPLPRAAL